MYINNVVYLFLQCMSLCKRGSFTYIKGSFLPSSSNWFRRVNINQKNIFRGLMYQWNCLTTSPMAYKLINILLTPQGSFQGAFRETFQGTLSLFKAARISILKPWRNCQRSCLWYMVAKNLTYYIILNVFLRCRRCSFRKSCRVTIHLNQLF